MQIKIELKPLDQLEADAVIVPVFEGKKEERFGAGDLFEAGEVSGKSLELTLLHHPPGVASKRVLLAGAGKPEKFNSAELRRVVGAAVRHLKSKSVKKIAFGIVPEYASADYVSAAVEGALLADYETDRYKTGNDKKSVDEFVVGSWVAQAAPPAVSPANARSTASGTGGQSGNPLEQGVSRGRILGEAQNFTRSLANEPGNLLTPSGMAEAARQMAAEYHLDCEILEQKQMEELGMGALLGVSQGSAEPPAFIVLRYQPEKPEFAAHLGLVGKGVTFDTGGISIKPSDSMEKMKYDMSGGAAMIGAMRAIAQLKPALKVTAFIPCVENMPGSRAQRPGDIVTAMSGKTIEVINTDAEGRLILADALTYARRQGCTHLVDAATLTGAVAVALGHLNSGLFANDDDMRDRVLRAAKAEGERMWPLPLEDDYKDYLKNPFADIGNVGGRYGGACTAAIFLKEFAEDTPWVHLDIAGTAWIDENKPFLSKGPSGVGVRTLVRLATEWN